MHRRGIISPNQEFLEIFGGRSGSLAGGDGEMKAEAWKVKKRKVCARRGLLEESCGSGAYLARLVATLNFGRGYFGGLWL